MKVLNMVTFGWDSSSRAEQLGWASPGDKDIAQRWTCQWTNWKRENKNEMAEYKIKGARNEWWRSALGYATVKTRDVCLSNRSVQCMFIVLIFKCLPYDVFDLISFTLRQIILNSEKKTSSPNLRHYIMIYFQPITILEAKGRRIGKRGYVANCEWRRTHSGCWRWNVLERTCLKSKDEYPLL